MNQKLEGGLVAGEVNGYSLRSVDVLLSKVAIPKMLRASVWRVKIVKSVSHFSTSSAAVSY